MPNQDIVNQYTPYSISQTEQKFQIPLYQRLFEWDVEQVEQLMHDLRLAYERNSEEPYYIGMLTAYVKNDIFELVDGQQRFTMMMLLGISFGWGKFVFAKGEELRLQFYAREEDSKYLLLKSKNDAPDTSIINSKMERALSTIQAYLEKHDLSKEKFGEFIFKHLTFFISQLPHRYSVQELNTYFERMNTAGKALENHEILKVDILRKINEDKEQYTILWNMVSRMEQTVLRLKTENRVKESYDSWRGRYEQAILEVIKGKIAYEKLLSGKEDEDESVDFRAIKDIPLSDVNPFKVIKRREDEHAMLTFPEFLLQVLYITLGCPSPKELPLNTTDFFDVHQLGSTFEQFMKKINLHEFLQNLVLFRLLMDYYLIRVDDDDEEPFVFELYPENNREVKARVKQYQSMLYAASSAMTYYLWLPELLIRLRNHVESTGSLVLDGNKFLDMLKEIDNSWHPLSSIDESELTYTKIDRYWFWRIDYYLWENRQDYFRNEELALAEDYVFRRNRSIEHIAPQHPMRESSFKWEEENLSDDILRDSLGNMVMISSGQNSTLTNETFEMKRAHISAYLKGQLNGHVESLKMLYVYQNSDNWSREKIQHYTDFFVQFLKQTYAITR